MSLCVRMGFVNCAAVVLFASITTFQSVFSCLRDVDCWRGEACLKNNCVRIECTETKDCGSKSLKCIKGLCKTKGHGFRMMKRVPKLGQCRSGFGCGTGKICNKSNICESLPCTSNKNCASHSIFKTICHRGKCQTDFCKNDADCPPMHGCFYTGYCRPFYGICPRELDCDCKSSSLMCYNRNCYCKDEGISNRCLLHCLHDNDCDSKCEKCRHHRCVPKDLNSKECVHKPICSTKGPKCCSDGDCFSKCLGSYCCDNSCKHQKEFPLPSRCECSSDRDCKALGTGFECHSCIAIPEYGGRKVCGQIDPKCCHGKEKKCQRNEVCLSGRCKEVKCRSNSTCPSCYHSVGNKGVCVRSGTCCTSDKDCRYSVGRKCVNGGCFSGSRCTAHDDCHRGQHCRKRTCQPVTYCCENDLDCPNGNQQCINHGCMKISTCHKNRDCKVCHVCKESKGGLKACEKAENCCDHGLCKKEEDFCDNGACVRGNVCLNSTECPPCHICNHLDQGEGRCIKASKCCSDNHGCAKRSSCHGGACIIRGNPNIIKEQSESQEDNRLRHLDKQNGTKTHINTHERQNHVSNSSKKCPKPASCECPKVDEVQARCELSLLKLKTSMQSCVPGNSNGSLPNKQSLDEKKLSTSIENSSKTSSTTNNPSFESDEKSDDEPEEKSEDGSKEKSEDGSKEKSENESKEEFEESESAEKDSDLDFEKSVSMEDYEEYTQEQSSEEEKDIDFRVKYSPDTKQSESGQSKLINHNTANEKEVQTSKEDRLNNLKDNKSKIELNKHKKFKVNQFIFKNKNHSIQNVSPQTLNHDTTTIAPTIIKKYTEESSTEVVAEQDLKDVDFFLDVESNESTTKGHKEISGHNDEDFDIDDIQPTYNNSGGRSFEQNGVINYDESTDFRSSYRQGTSEFSEEKKKDKSPGFLLINLKDTKDIRTLIFDPTHSTHPSKIPHILQHLQEHLNKRKETWKGSKAKPFGSKSVKPSNSKSVKPTPERVKGEQKGHQKTFKPLITKRKKSINSRGTTLQDQSKRNMHRYKYAQLEHKKSSSNEIQLRRQLFKDALPFCQQNELLGKRICLKLFCFKADHCPECSSCINMRCQASENCCIENDDCSPHQFCYNKKCIDCTAEESLGKKIPGSRCPTSNLG